MKTSNLKQIVLAVALLVSYSISVAASVKSSAPNIQNVPIIEFFSVDTIIVVTPENCTICPDAQSDIENSVFWQLNHYRPVYVYKTENKLSRQDTKQHLLFYGCLHQFQRKEFFKIPVRKTSKGFQFKGQSFESDTDEFFYVNQNASRMYLCGNDLKTPHAFFSKGGTPYPLHIFSNSNIVLTGEI